MLATRFQTLAGDARHIVGVAPAPHTRRDAWSAPAAIRARNAGSMSEFGDTVDRNDIDRFAAQSAAWGDPEGSFRPLHRINPARLDFIRHPLPPCFCRDARAPLPRLAFAVAGSDAAAPAIEVARAHAEAGGLAIDYRAASIEEIAAAGERF